MYLSAHITILIIHRLWFKVSVKNNLKLLKLNDVVESKPINFIIDKPKKFNPSAPIIKRKTLVITVSANSSDKNDNNISKKKN